MGAIIMRYINTSKNEKANLGEKRVIVGYRQDVCSDELRRRGDAMRREKAPAISSPQTIKRSVLLMSDSVLILGVRE